MISGVFMWTLSRLSAGTEFSADCPLKTGVEGDPIGDSVVSICGTIKRVGIALMQVLAVEFAGSAGVVKTKVVELTVSRRMFCCVELPEKATPEGTAREGVDILALLIDANSFWLAVLRMMFTAGATTTLVTNASAMLTKSPVSVKAAMLWIRRWCRELIFERPASESVRCAACE